jgi:hypothetical protein
MERSTEIIVKGEGFPAPLPLEPRDCEHFRVLCADGLEVKGVLGIQEVAQQFGPDYYGYSVKGAVMNPDIYRIGN